jgi:hypothetical protein
MSEYFCEATSVAGFVQQLALGYVQYGYHFYVPGSVPQGKDPGGTDRSIIARYGINVSRWTRYERARAGLANMHYLRFERFFVLIASRGQHSFFEAEKAKIRDIRKMPVRFAGYSIGYQRQKGRPPFTWHPSVRIEKTEYTLLKERFRRLATWSLAEELAEALHSLPFEPYAPIRQQYLALLRLVNKRRKLAGLDLVPVAALRLGRRSVLPFGDRLAHRATSHAKSGLEPDRQIRVQGEELLQGSAVVQNGNVAFLPRKG